MIALMRIARRPASKLLTAPGRRAIGPTRNAKGRFGEHMAAMIKSFCPSPEDIPLSRGAYVLAIRLAKPVTVMIAGRRAGTLPAGRYLYCGSAQGPGGLKARLGRHMRRGKTIRWHVDQLTEHGTVEGAWIFPGGDECDVVAALSQLPMPIAGFGSTDCRRCRSHLLAWPHETLPWRQTARGPR